MNRRILFELAVLAAGVIAAFLRERSAKRIECDCDDRFCQHHCNQDDECPS